MTTTTESDWARLVFRVSQLEARVPTPDDSLLRQAQYELRNAAAQLASATLAHKHATDLYNAAFNDWSRARVAAAKAAESPKQPEAKPQEQT